MRGISTKASVYGCCGKRGYSSTQRKRRALPITETELKLMAAAIMGLSKRPKAG